MLWKDVVIAAIWLIWLPFALLADTGSLFRQGALPSGQGSLFATNVAVNPAVKQHFGSLFAGEEGASLFASYPSLAPRLTPRSQTTSGQSRAARIRHLIAKAEAGAKGYDAVQYGATIRPTKPPTSMTIAEIYQWIDDTPGQPHAIGRYQFIPKTLRALVKRLDVDPKIKFTPAVQDLLADSLLADAGLSAMNNGEIGRHVFMKNLAKIWAGLPTSTGKSYYHGHAGNKATMTWAVFDAEMRKIFPG